MTTEARLTDELIAAAKGLSPVAVGQWLGLEPARRQRYKYPCVFPGCDSSDGLDLRPGKPVKCFACGVGGSVVDLVMAARGLPFADAVRAIADGFGILTLDGPARFAAPIPRRPTPPTSTAPPVPTAEETAARARREEVLAAALDVLTLTARGRAYLEGEPGRGPGRRIPAGLALADGFRSLDVLDDWRVLYRALRNRFPEAQLHESLFPLDTREGKDGKPWLPWGGRVPVLVIPYRYRGRVLALRFRNLAAGPTDKFRYLSILGAGTPPLPFNADALDDLAGQELHVVEGELNAYALALNGLRAVSPGPAAGWRPEWSALVKPAARVVAWYDNDKAGEKGAERLAAALHASPDLGRDWLAAHGCKFNLSEWLAWEGIPTAGIQDANDLHRSPYCGRLLAAAPWR